MDRTRALGVVKAVHTAIWLAVETAMGYLLYSGARGHSDKRAAVAGAIVAGETLLFLGNGARCPLTDVAESLGAGSGSVTDLYLPKWLARSLPAIHVPLVALVLFLHGRNIRSRKLITTVANPAFSPGSRVPSTSPDLTSPASQR